MLTSNTYELRIKCGIHADTIPTIWAGDLVMAKNRASAIAMRAVHTHTQYARTVRQGGAPSLLDKCDEHKHNLTRAKDQGPGK